MANQRQEPRYFMQDDDQAIHRKPPRHLQLRARSFTEPTPHCTPDNTERLVQSAQEISFIEDSEDEIPVILSSISTSLPRFSSIYNSFHSSLETSLLLMNHRCNEESQYSNENFNQQDFAVMSQSSYYHECHISEPATVSNDDSDVILINLTIHQDKYEHEEYDYDNERNISIDSNVTEEFDKRNILLGLESAKILAPKVEVDFSQEPNDNEILECSTQCGEEDNVIEVETDNMNVTSEVVGQQFENLVEEKRAKVEPKNMENSRQNTLSSNCIHENKNKEILIETFPGEIKILKRSPKKEDEKANLKTEMNDDNRVNKPQRKELKPGDSYENNSDLKNEKEVGIGNDVQGQTNKCHASNEENGSKNHDSKRILENSERENYTPLVSNNSSVSLQNLKNSTAKITIANAEQKIQGKSTKENNKELLKCDNEHVTKDIPKLSNNSKSKTTKTSTTKPATINQSLANTASNKENIDRGNRKIVRKRIASKPLSEICNLHPRSRVGLSKRVKIDSLHHKLKNK